MKQAFCLFIGVVFLFGAAVVHGMSNIQSNYIDTWYSLHGVDQVEYSIRTLYKFLAWWIMVPEVNKKKKQIHKKLNIGSNPQGDRYTLYSAK